MHGEGGAFVNTRNVVLEDLRTIDNLVVFIDKLVFFNDSLIKDLKYNINRYYNFKTTAEIKSYLRNQIKHNLRIAREDKAILVRAKVYKDLSKSIVDLYKFYCYYI